MKKVKNLVLGLSVALLALVFIPQSSFALPIYGSGVLSSFDGSLNYDASTATLTVVLHNTTSSSVGGYLTAFVFNNPSNYITGVSNFTTTNPNFAVMGGPSFSNGINGAPNGQFDIGASSTGGQFEGGGSPNNGIAAGDTATFTFTFTGSFLDTLTINSFLSELSTGHGAGGGDYAFVARFRGLDGNPDSEKIPFRTIPEPTTLSLLSLGLLGLINRSKRRINV